MNSPPCNITRQKCRNNLTRRASNEENKMNELIRALARIDRVLALGLGGSRGLGIANNSSDYDIVLFRAGGPAISPADIRNAIESTATGGKLEVTANLVRFEIDGRTHEFFQKDVNAIQKEIVAAREGKFTWYLKQLFPHGDLSTSVISHIVYLKALSDEQKVIARLQSLATPMPSQLRASLIKYFLTQTEITTIHALKVKKSEDYQYLNALCSAFIFFANILIFAANGRYPVTEKGGARLIAQMKLKPERYYEDLAILLDHDNRSEFRKIHATLVNMLKNVRTMCAVGGTLPDAHEGSTS